MKFSLIIPVYNTAPELFYDCVNSIINQSYDSFEVIIINDGSKEELFKEYCSFIKGNSRFNIYTIQNSGVSCARNYGLTKAKGDYIIFIDADDWIESDALVKIARVANNSDILLFPYYENDGATESYQSCFRDEIIDFSHFGKDDLIRSLTQKHFRVPGENNTNHASLTFGTPWAKVYNNELLRNRKCCFPQKMEFAEDIVFNRYCVYYADRIQFFNIPFYHYRIVPDSASHKNIDSRKIISRKERVIDELQQFLDILPYKSDLMPELSIQKMELYDQYLYYIAESPSDAKKYFTKILNRTDIENLRICKDPHLKFNANLLRCKMFNLLFYIRKTKKTLGYLRKQIKVICKKLLQLEIR